jgi:hypothetical protein
MFPLVPRAFGPVGRNLFRSVGSVLTAVTTVASAPRDLILGINSSGTVLVDHPFPFTY